MDSLKTLHENHQGKVSDKWTRYLEDYDPILTPYRNQTINLLEIGVQNGGSLEVWSKYFPEATHIIGCDINEKCQDLHYDDPRIQVIIGDAGTDATKQQILAIVPTFDIIIDDGSHTSGDIVRNFAHYFDRLNDNGTFIIEDLHCSYWQEFDGGLYHPYSAINFLKNLADIVNHEHWGLPLRNNETLEEICHRYNVITPHSLAHIHSVEFINSVCIIKKRTPNENELGVRIIAGQEAVVVENKTANHTRSITPSQIDTIYPQSQTQVILGLQAQLDEMQQNLTAAQQQNQQDKTTIATQSAQLVQLTELSQLLNTKLAQIEKKVLLLEKENNQSTQHLHNHISNLDNHIAGLQNYTASLESKTKRQAKLWTFRLLKPLFNTERAISSANRYRKQFTSLVREKGSIGKAYQFLRHAYKQTHSFQTVKQLLKSSNQPAIAISDAPLPPVPEIFQNMVSQAANETCALKVAIIGEMSIPQCKKYRVTQKQEMFKALGIPCSVTSWTDYEEAKKQISLASVVIFYRVPAFDSVMALINECRRLRIKTYWDVDDLIFDEETLKISSTINSLDEQERDGVINGARLYRKAMLACDEGIASTSGLAEAMREAGLKTVHIVENALDIETLKAAQEINSKAQHSDNIIRIIYGSGTKTHNIDFMEAAAAVAETLKKYPNVRFRYIGYLELPADFDDVKDQIEHIHFCNYTEYLAYLAECDISIAPLENFIFNDAKSNIKYLEASITKLASVCSPRAAFADAIEQGKTAFLADSKQQWLDAFDALIQDEQLRHNMAAAAYESVTQRYAPAAVGKTLAAAVQDAAFDAQKSKVLTFNVYYHPQSFGGATIVAEQLNKLLAKDGNHKIYAVTTLPVSHYLKAYDTIRYEYKQVTVFGVAVPSQDMENYDNPLFSKVVAEIIELVQPEIAHIHCIQGIGVGVMDLCHKKGIKTVVTFHDAWWICPNQFMLDGEKFRENWDDVAFANGKMLEHTLSQVDLLLAPSQYFADVHEKKLHQAVRVNKNGVTLPIHKLEKRKSDVIRFGYVGGKTSIKGVHLILEAFRLHNFENTRLCVVDNMINVGAKSFYDQDFAGIQNYQIMPAYNQNTIDQFFAEIDVLLFPTQWKESFGLTVREAILRDVWVIATDGGGVVEDIIDGENGTIIPFDSDAEDLSQAIRDVCKRYQAMPDGAIINLPKAHIRSFAEQKDELAQMYQELLADKTSI